MLAGVVLSVVYYSGGTVAMVGDSETKPGNKWATTDPRQFYHIGGFFFSPLDTPV